MRSLYFLVLLNTLHFLSFSQVADDFEDGDYTNNPSWIADANKFTINNGILQSSSSTVNDVFGISTEHKSVQNTEWEFFVELKFATSSNNYVEVHLVADNRDLPLSTNGYFLRIGDTKDQITLYKKENGTNAALILGTEAFTENKKMWIKVTCDQNYNWQLLANNAGQKNYNVQGFASDNAIQNSDYFGFLVKQSTASFFEKHFFDNVYVGAIRIDKEAPKLTSATFENKQTIHLRFNEPVKTLNTTQFTLTGIGNPSTITENTGVYALSFAQAIGSGTYTLSLQNIQDISGNRLDTSVNLSLFVPKPPKLGDLIFNEIYANPSNSRGLPDNEYLEIYNASNDTLNLQKCSLTKGSTPAIFPSHIMFPNTYLIVCKNGAETDYILYGTTLNLTSFPALNNDKASLYLLDSNNALIDSVSYSDTWYSSTAHKNGSYSLERIFTKSNCASAANWTSSIASIGGTPGAVNSVNNLRFDSIAPKLLSAEIVPPSTILLLFDEGVDKSTDIQNFSLEGNRPTSLTFASNNSALTLTFNQVFASGEAYSIKIEDIADCIGNRQKESKIAPVAIAEIPLYNDLIFNEILPNPYTNQESFIEIYNKSEKYIDLSKLQLARLVDKVIKDQKNISINKQILAPGGYAVLGKKLDSLLLIYPGAAAETFYESTIPTLTNSAGTIMMYNENNTTLDSFAYAEKMHFALLNSVKGVSLERKNMDRPSTDFTNWTSAAANVYFATPGYKNSQTVDLQANNSEIALKSKTISPNLDGYEDALEISWKLPSADFILEMSVFGLGGNFVHYIAQNYTVTQEGNYSWDGILKDGSKIPSGNYVLRISGLDEKGGKVYKKLAFSVVVN